MYAKVIIDSNSRYLDRSFTYNIPEKFNNKVKKGMRVIVPFGRGNKATIAFIYDLISEKDGDYKVKDILDLYDLKKIVSDELIDLAFFMKKKYLSSINSAIKQILPPGNITEIREYFYKKENFNHPLSNFLTKPRSRDEIFKKFGDIGEEIRDYLDKGYIGIDYDVKRTGSIKYLEYVNLVEAGFEIDTLPKNANKQRQIISYIKENGKTEVKEILSKTQATRSSLNSLIKKEIINLEKIEEKRKILKEPKKYDKIKLNREQEMAYNKVLANPCQTFLLKGVTGSGKTEVFLQLVEENIKNGKEAIVLVPEISLTPQTIERFTGRFGNKIAVIHSRLSISERFDQRRLINQGQVKIVIGARSAIFAPFKNLGIIIIDEEHDQSYYSSKDPKYHTYQIAKFRSEYNKASLILASATPSVRSMMECQKGNYTLLELKNRVNNNDPDIEVVDMREELKNSNYSMISRKLYQEIRQTLDQGNQAILFLNKIGHNSFTFCRQCGYVIKCDACDVSMTYHKHINKLVCHYCGRTKNQPRICPNCGSKKIKEFGAGTEKLEEEVRELFKDANILRMDSQTVSGRESYEKMYALMKDNKLDILIGTQMIAKGLDFKDVTLVGIISADLSLNIDDYNAQETTFQLLTQVAGRAGRDQKKGRVIIQTYKPENFVINAASNADYKAFYEKEMQLRKAYKYPPFTNLITIRIVNKSRTKTIALARQVRLDLDKTFANLTDIDIIGPNPCKIGRINNKYRYNIIVKVADEKLDYLVKNIGLIKDKFIVENKDTAFITAINPTSIN